MGSEPGAVYSLSMLCLRCKLWSLKTNVVNNLVAKEVINEVGCTVYKYDLV